MRMKVCPLPRTGLPEGSDSVPSRGQKDQTPFSDARGCWEPFSHEMVQPG